MNFKTPNICAKRAEKMQYLVYFEQISLPKIKKNDKKLQNSSFLEKNSSTLEKNSSFLASKLNEPVVGHYTPLP